MEFKTTEDVIRFAIQKEEASVQFYQDLAVRMEDPATKIIFEILRQNELQHKSNLELELMKLGKTVAEQPYRISDEQDRYYIIEVDEEARKMSFTDALRMAVRKEKAAFVLFTELLAQTGDPQLRNVFLNLAEEEMRHIIQLENEYNSIVSGKKKDHLSE
jgi:rubrerythrin